MDMSLFVGLSQQSALRRKMDVIAHNIANMNTTAYKKEKVVFREFLVDVQNKDGTKDGKVSFMIDQGVVRDLKQGAYQHTGNQLDIYLDGKGYFSVLGNDGEELYTRNGHLSRNNEHFLVLSTGEQVLNDEGDPIQFQENDTDITISDTGEVSTENGLVGKIGLYQFENENALKRRGTSLYETDEAPLDELDPTQLSIRQGAIEGSNINSVKSMVEMIDVMRAYQASSRNMEKFQDLRKDSLDRLANVQ